jgi:hypothetical protein
MYASFFADINKVLENTIVFESRAAVVFVLT